MKLFLTLLFLLISIYSDACEFVERYHGSYSAAKIDYTYYDNSTLDYGPLKLILEKTSQGFRISECQVSMWSNERLNCWTPEVIYNGTGYHYIDRNGARIPIQVSCTGHKLSFSHFTEGVWTDPWIIGPGLTEWILEFKDNEIYFSQNYAFKDPSGKELYEKFNSSPLKKLR